MQNAGAVLAALCERGRKTLSRSRHKSLESPVHRKVPAGFGGRRRGKGPQQRDLAAQPILLVGVHGKHLAQVPLTEDQHPVGDLGPDRQHEAFSEAVARGHRGGILTTSIPASAMTASNEDANWPARSRTRN